jgi:hypothetical protein
MGENETVQTLTDLTDVLPGLIEFEQTRRGTHEYPVGTQRRIHGACAGVSENMTLGVGGDANGFA